MKKAILISVSSVIVLAVVALLVVHFSDSDTVNQDKVMRSLGECNNGEYYCDGGIDPIGYGVYNYDSVDFSENEYFSQVQESDLENKGDYSLKGFVTNFDSMIRYSIASASSDSEVVENYNFDLSIMDSEDYFYIDCKTPDTFSGYFLNYRVYFFDVQTNTLYYFLKTV